MVLERNFKIALISFFLLCSCAREKEVNYVFKPSVMDVEFVADVKQGSSDKVDLKLKFTSIDSVQISLDAKSFTTECYYYKDKKHLDSFTEGNNRNINALCNSFEYSQVLIENTRGELKLLSTVTEKRTVRDFNTPDCVGSWTETKKGKYIEFDVSNIYIEDLQIREDDNELRLYYLFKGDSLNNTAISLRSTWLKL